jgi:hypothetical protein
VLIITFICFEEIASQWFCFIWIVTLLVKIAEALWEKLQSLSAVMRMETSKEVLSRFFAGGIEAVFTMTGNIFMHKIAF